MNKEERVKLFLSYFDEINNMLVSELKDYEMPELAKKYMDRMTTYNVKGGKLNRGIAVLDTVILLKEKPTEEEMKEACIVGWCIEWLQAFFLVADDIMDQSTLRRNQPCWYKVKDVQLFACNDYVILENHVYRILKKYFKKRSFYVDLLEIFLETTYKTELGQLLDLRTLPPDEELNLNNFTMDAYKKIVKYKTAFYSFYLPIVCGLILSEKATEDNLILTQEICVEMGEYFQIQDDFLDCYANEKVLGKIGRDIEEKKCCWMIVNALQLCTEEQKEILKKNYGIDDKECVKKVKSVYQDLNMTKYYQEYESNAIQSLKLKIKNIEFNQEIFLSLLSKIEKRTK